MLFFATMGILLIFLILGLNLTVSTGLINGLIFYSNIVSSNNDTLLPLNTETNSHLQNMIRFLYTFKAWVNLDFGIETCFFDGYDIYISTWMQFLFPLYIWLLILAIVLASKYSRRISKLTTSNTVPVLATLMLLSYTKLLTTLIGAVSFTDLQFLENAPHSRVWLLDGNILYLKGKHLPLFLISILWVIGYILPFTLLVLLGPILQAKSHYKYLHWVNKLKPFFDAFYGPYTSTYRYWPGLLLVARLILLNVDAFSSLGDSPYKLASTSVIVAFLFAFWIILARKHGVLLYQHWCPNYLELFFHFNLLFFTTASMYFRCTKTEVMHQQILAVVMVGSSFATVCGILIYQTLLVLYKFKAITNLVQSIPTKEKATNEVNQLSYNPKQDGENNAQPSPPTQSMLEMSTVNELREPLLTS